ncbi:MAG: HesA/MoeB/ThiF family protein [Candidatus Hydrogenedentes bacterium]|nr:HesA/MoeB/ThiF family protein [Candidatus Hydrogenedentota bacterium]
MTPRDEATYYSRQTVLPEVGIDGQQKLKKSRVLVVGAGGLGCPALQFLAAAGVGTIGICDADRLDASNLHRQVLYHYRDIGEPKAELAAQRIRELNPFITVTAYTERVHADNARAYFDQYDVVLDCTDNFESKYLLNDTAVQTNTPLVQAGVYKFEGQIHVCDPAEGTGCLRCLWPETPEEGSVGSCAEVGVLGMVPGLLGTMQATETVKLILGLPGVLRGAMLLINLLNYRVHRMAFPKNPACPVCGNAPQPVRRTPVPNDPVTELEVEIAALTPDALREFSVIDIREAFETQARPLTELPCREIPMSQFAADTLADDGKVKYLLCCAHGVRSRNLALALRRNGLQQVYSLKGGVAALE